MNNIFIYVEGEDDVLFMEQIISPILLSEKFTYIHTIKYAKKSPKKINKDIKSKSNHDYLFLSDLDHLQYPCITSRKNNRLNKYNFLINSKIIIVKEEIESWFLAGIDTSLNQFKDLNIPTNTDNITKEDFNIIFENSKFNRRNDFLLEISKNFNFELAINKNKSFKYFLTKLNLLN